MPQLLKKNLGMLEEREVCISLCVLVELNLWLKVQVARMPVSLLKLNLDEAMGIQNKYVIAWQDCEHLMYRLEKGHSVELQWTLPRRRWFLLYRLK